MRLGGRKLAQSRFTLRNRLPAASSVNLDEGIVATMTGDATMAEATEFLRSQGLNSSATTAARDLFAQILTTLSRGAWPHALNLFVADVTSGGDGQRGLRAARIVDRFFQSSGDWMEQEGRRQEVALLRTEVGGGELERALAALDDQMRDKSLQWLILAAVLVGVATPVASAIVAVITLSLGAIAEFFLVEDLVEALVSLVLVAFPLRVAYRVTRTKRSPAVRPRLTPLVIVLSFGLFVWFRFLIYLFEDLLLGHAADRSNFIIAFGESVTTEWLFLTPFVAFCILLLFGSGILRISEEMSDIADAVSEFPPLRYAMYLAVSVILSLLIRLLVAAVTAVVG
jgi:hypothetical protein